MKKFLRKMKKVLSIMLVLSMIFTSHAFVTFAENVEETTEETTSIENVEETTETTVEEDDNVEASKENVEASEENVGDSEGNVGASEENVGASDENVGASDENVGANEENVGASSASPEEEDDEKVEDETDYPEEPEEDPTTEVESEEETEESVEASEENVGASTASPELESDEEEASETESEEETLINVEEMAKFDELNKVPLYGAKYLSSVSLETYTVADYDIGDTIDTSNLSINRYYKEEGTFDAGMGEPGPVLKFDDAPDNFRFEPDYYHNPFTTRGQEIEVRVYYEEDGYEDFFTMIFRVGTVTAVNVTTPPTKTSYRVGEDFDPTGLVVTVVWKNNETTPFSYDSNPSAFTLTSNATNLDESVTEITYRLIIAEELERTVRIPITVTDKSVTSATIGTMPTKREYTSGEEFDPSGLVLNVTYDDSSTETLTCPADSSKMIFDPELGVALSTSDTKVTVTVGSVSVDIPITVNKAVQSIAVKSSNATTTATTDTFTSYSVPLLSVGEDFDPTGMVIEVTYDDGSKEPVTYDASKVTITPDPSNSNDLIVQYAGKSVTYPTFKISETDFYIYYYDNTNTKRAVAIHDDSFIGWIDKLYTYVANGSEKGFYVMNATSLQNAYSNYNANATATMTLAEALAEAQNITSVLPYAQNIYWGVTNKAKSQGGGNTPGGNNYGGDSDSGSSSSSESDPTKGPLGNLSLQIDLGITGETNTTNDIPQGSLKVDTGLAVQLKSLAENLNSKITNARDKFGHKGFGQWLRVPKTTTWYFLSGELGQTNGQSSGFLAGGWYNLGWDGQDKWYYFDENGVMKLGWHQEGDKIYFLQDDFTDNWYGRRTTGSKMIGGILYNFNDEGELINSSNNNAGGTAIIGDSQFVTNYGNVAGGLPLNNTTGSLSNQDGIHIYGGELTAPNMISRSNFEPGQE